MRWRTSAVLVLGVWGLVACSDTPPTNPHTLGAAVGQYLADKGALCLQLNHWPVDVIRPDVPLHTKFPSSTSAQLEALEALGLAKGFDFELQEITDGIRTGRTSKLRRYLLTNEGQKYFRRADINSLATVPDYKAEKADICYGEKTLARVKDWVGPMKFGTHKEVVVKYLYQIENLASWALDPKFQAAFPEAAQAIAGAQHEVQQIVVKLSSHGWEHKKPAWSSYRTPNTTPQGSMD